MPQTLNVEYPEHVAHPLHFLSWVLLLSMCAVQRRRFPVGESPTRPTRSSRKQPERS
jgi:hypothetical protein